MRGYRSIRRHDGCPQARARDGCRAPHAARTPGFSLIELMLAMTILGLGLVLVATMFPVAWSRARDLAEFTVQENITKSAEVILQQIAQVDDAEDSIVDGGSFAGDIIYFEFSPSETMFFVEANPRVHALYMENLTVGVAGADRRFVPNRDDASDFEDYAPWRLEQVDRSDFQLTTVNVPPPFYGSAFGDAQISFEQRVYPPLPRRDLDTVDGTGLFTDEDEKWENALDRSRYAWAILHRLRRDPMTFEEWNALNLRPDSYKILAGEPREFDIYYVTLRRTRPTLRYAVQDAAVAPDPFAADGATVPRRGLPVQVAALDEDMDVILPVPWRVQVWFPAGVPLAANATGVPTEIEVNTDNAATDTPFLIHMFAVGTPFIDEANGKIYRVARRRITGDDADAALITLDQEVVLEDIDDGFWTAAVENQFGDKALSVSEQRRTVWVFPPPVEPERDGAGNPIFNGRQPVVGINVRSLTVKP